MVSAIWLAVIGSFVAQQSSPDVVRWGYTLTLTSLAVSLTVNAAVTGIIMLRILKVYWQIRSSCDQTSGSGVHNPGLRSIIFVIIESGMVLFAIQLVRIVLYILQLGAYEIIVGINEMFNVIIRSVIFYFFFFTLLKLFPGNNTHSHPRTSVSRTLFPWWKIHVGDGWDLALRRVSWWRFNLGKWRCRNCGTGP